MIVEEKREERREGERDETRGGRGRITNWMNSSISDY